LLQRFSECATTGQISQKLSDRRLVRASRGMALKLFQRGDNGQAGGGELPELMIKISPPRELSRRES
jgi:hypothetical protein